MIRAKPMCVGKSNHTIKLHQLSNALERVLKDRKVYQKSTIIRNICKSAYLVEGTENKLL